MPELSDRSKYVSWAAGPKDIETFVGDVKTTIHVEGKQEKCVNKNRKVCQQKDTGKPMTDRKIFFYTHCVVVMVSTMRGCFA